MAALWYSALAPAALSLFVLLLGLFLIGGGAFCSGEGCGLLSPSLLLPVILFVVLVILIYPVLYWYLFSYEVSEHALTVNSGIFFRQYETIDFGRIQTIDNERGPLLWLFGLTIVEIWTASADQMQFSVEKNSVKTRPRPDTLLILRKDDAQILKDFIMSSKTSGGL